MIKKSAGYICLLACLLISPTLFAQVVGVQDYYAALSQARLNCELPVTIDQSNQNPPSIVNGNGGIAVLGGQDGQRRGLSECQAAKYFSASPGSYICVISDAKGLILGVGSAADSFGGYINAVTNCADNYPSNYQNVCAQGPTACFYK